MGSLDLAVVVDADLGRDDDHCFVGVGLNVFSEISSNLNILRIKFYCFIFVEIIFWPKQSYYQVLRFEIIFDLSIFIEINCYCFFVYLILCLHFTQPKIEMNK